MSKKIFNETFRHKIMSVTGDMDQTSDETAFNNAIVKILDAYSGDCLIDVQIHGFTNVRGVETRVATCIITNKRRVFHTMDKSVQDTFKGKEHRTNGGKVVMEMQAIVKVYEALGFNYAVDSLDQQLHEDIVDFMIYNNLCEEVQVQASEGRISEMWETWQSK